MNHIDTCIFLVLTLRICLSIINSIYDPLGLIAPITIKLKVAFRDLFRVGLNLEWDDVIPSEDKEKWRTLIEMLTSAKSIVFPRATKPANAIGKCQLICFFDGSDSAYAAVLYVRWVCDDGSVFTTLVSSKSRVTPLNRISTPRSELCGAVIAARLVLSTCHSWASANEIPEKIWMIGDSECTLASIEKVNAAFGEFFGNRIGEILSIQAKIEKYTQIGNDGEWWHTDTKNNGADIATRLDSSPADIDFGSKWQTGEDFLKLLPCQWPINRDFANRKDDCIPKGEILKKYRAIVNANMVQLERVTGVSALIDPYSTNDWTVLLRKTQCLLNFVQQSDSKKKTEIAQGKVDARVLWFRSVMKDTDEACQQGKLRELDIQERNGMKVVVGRAKEGLREFYGQNYLPVIMGHTRIAELVMLAAHNLDHTGRDITQAIARHEVWIVNAKKLAKQIVKGCIRCRFLRKILENQKMAALPDYVQIQCPPFTNIGLDLTGPITVKAMTNKRSKMKIWVVIFLCLNTKAVCMELAPGYSTEDFLCAYEIHTSQRGFPGTVHSDRGSQLIAANKEISDSPLHYDWDAIASSSSKEGTKWNFTPAGAQWRNGATEAFVKKFKHSFLHLYKDTKLNFAELNCAVKRIANVLNHRPLSVKRYQSDGQTDDFLSPTPNMLMTGRSASGPPQDYLDEDDPKLRLTFLQELERAWWYQYKVQYFDSLVPTRKWSEKKRNMCVGDVVLIEYKSKSMPGTYRLGKVRETEIDHNGLVRTCVVTYKLVRPINNNNRNTTDDVVTKDIRVPIQRLVLILPIEEQL